MKKFITILVSFAFVFFGIQIAYAATQDTSVSDVLGTTSNTTTTSTENSSTTADSLKLAIATQTDNPSSVITFTDPSPDKSGVQLEVDNKGFADIVSPYTFGALSIGKHTLEFKYVDENGTTQVYDTSIIIIPRAPILNTPTVNTNTIEITGTGLANAEIILVISNGQNVASKISSIDTDGNWSISFERKDLLDGVYSISAYIRRYGYASNLSETTKFTIGEDANSNDSNGNQPFSLSSFTFNDIKNLVISNDAYIFTAILSIAVGIFIGLIINNGQSKKKEEKNIQKVAVKFTNTDAQKKEPTLREKLMGAIEKEEENETPKEVNTAEEETVINKIDFLKDFKKFDPDDNNGKEKKGNPEVSLTSKKKDS